MEVFEKSKVGGSQNQNAFSDGVKAKQEEYLNGWICIVRRGSCWLWVR